MTSPEIKVLADAEALARETAERIAAAAVEAIETHDTFTLALSGGSTPRPAYELLAQEPFRSRVSWNKVEIYFGDERCVPPDSPQSNYRMANQALLSRVPIPAGNVHRIRGEIDPNDAAKEYGQMLKERFGDGGGFDLGLLGMGADGHTASLFPGTQALRETHHRCVANFVPKLAWRVTLTPPFINRSEQVMFLVAGADKSQILSKVLEEAPDVERYPVQSIRPEGRLIWLVDAAAAGME